jgi:hypothetical protein
VKGKIGGLKKQKSEVPGEEWEKAMMNKHTHSHGKPRKKEGKPLNKVEGKENTKMRRRRG